MAPQAVVPGSSELERGGLCSPLLWISGRCVLCALWCRVAPLREVIQLLHRFLQALCLGREMLRLCGLSCSLAGIFPYVAQDLLQAWRQSAGRGCIEVFEEFEEFLSHHLFCNSVPFPIIWPSGNFSPLSLCPRGRRAGPAPSSPGQAIQSLVLHFLGLWGGKLDLTWSTAELSSAKALILAQGGCRAPGVSFQYRVGQSRGLSRDPSSMVRAGSGAAAWVSSGLRVSDVPPCQLCCLLSPEGKPGAMA